MIGFNPAMYTSDIKDEDDKMIRVVQVTRNNIPDVQEWAESFGHQIINDDNFEEYHFVIAGESLSEEYFEVEVCPGEFLAIDLAHKFLILDDSSVLEDEYMRLN